MTKKGKLVGTIVVLIFVAIMIPIAIFATQNVAQTQVANLVKYQAQYLDGVFYYAVTGNKLDKDTYSTFDIGYTPSSKTINPELLFRASYDDTNDIDIVRDKNNAEITEPQIAVESKGLEFGKQENEKVISYYFIYANYATENPQAGAFEDRSVTISVSTQTDLPAHVTKNWYYTENITTSDNVFTTFQDTNFNWTNNNDAVANGIKVEARDNETTYHYLILKFTLTLTEEIAFENANISLTININGEHSN